jgi:cytochrome o ubiquinol oxidase subunit IV
MSNHTPTHHAEPDYGMRKKTFSVYFSGVLLCIVLTLIPFAAVSHHAFSKPVTFLIIFLSAIIQFFVQVICFLRLNKKTEQGTINVWSFAFTGLVLLIIVGGSLWIMWNLNYNMMS